jgi:hypothetical protein
MEEQASDSVRIARYGEDFLPHLDGIDDGDDSICRWRSMACAPTSSRRAAEDINGILCRKNDDDARGCENPTIAGGNGATATRMAVAMYRCIVSGGCIYS